MQEKLVRDAIPSLISASGHLARVRRVRGAEYLRALEQKLREETDEVLAAQLDEVQEELADVLEVLRALADAHGLRWEEVEQTRVEKAESRGAFRDGQMLRLDA